MRATPLSTLCLSAIVAGCGSSTVDLTAANRVRAADVDSAALDVAPPRVTVQGTDMVVAGTVTRRPDFDGPVPGRLVVTVLAADQQTVLDEFTTGWNPPRVPVDGDRRSAYTVRYGLVPPDGATVRVEHELAPDGPRAQPLNQPGQTQNGVRRNTNVNTSRLGYNSRVNTNVRGNTGPRR